MAVLICKPIIEIPPRCGGIFLGRGMSKKQERKRIMGKKRMFAALLALADDGGLPGTAGPGGLYRHGGALGGDRHYKVE